MIERRHFLKHMAAVTASSLFSVQLPRICAWAQSGESRPHFFMFVFARGGWDPTMVFEPKVGLDTIDVDPGGDVAELNGIRFLDNPGRPMVRTFFQDFGDRACVINGVNTGTNSHSNGEEIMMTGSAGMNDPDWGTIMISQNNPEDFLIPYMALSGPSFSGTLGNGTASGSGFLDLLVGGGVSNTPSATVEANMDEYISRHYTAHMNRLFAQGKNGSRFSEMEDSLGRWKELKDVKTELGEEFNNLNGLANEGSALATAFERGYALTGSLRARGSWDSHNNNFNAQSPAFENTFTDLHAIVTALASKNATSGSGTLLDQTTVIVMSEFGRTPKLNGSNGKDHWADTSVMAIGGGVLGGRVLGGTDDYQKSLEVDYSTGLVDPSGAGKEIKPINIGAALLEMAGLNPSSFLPSDIQPFNAFRA
ncbi:MAG: DUF1501 domain-containing protein [Candidatus Omnitrophica bacterium]|nr:DUF1501 domain-containing protein [Candidatus Omnitrophota bacterium]